LDIAKKKLAESKPQPQPQTSAPQMPNLANLMSNPAVANLMGQFGGGQGGAPDFGQIFQNPAFQTFASQMMSNPNFMNMAQNLMSNPDTASNMMNMAQQMGVDPSALPNFVPPASAPGPAPVKSSTGIRL
jgi:hypothetical protein